jgi:hypothetical protein
MTKHLKKPNKNSGIHKAARKKGFRAALKEGNRKYARMLKRLAK